jgi:2-alkyl-3-oxoalkanoate reductase
VEPAGWAGALAGADAMIHTAAIVSNAASLDDAWRVNVLGTSRTLAAAAEAGVRRVVHLSSVTAFGFDYPDGVDETYPVRVTGYSYPDTRVNSEAAVLAAHAAGTVDATVVRPGDVYGPGSVWVREPLRLIRAHQAVLPAGGRGRFSPIYLDDLVDGVLLALSSTAASGQIFTLAGAQDVSCSDYFDRLAVMAGGRVRTLPTPISMNLARVLGATQRRLGRDSELTTASILMLTRRGGYSIAKARRMLGFDPAIDLDEGMARVERWARAEGLI